jgi:hypothetical protein
MRLHRGCTQKYDLTISALFVGWIVDYEPDTNYTQVHAEAYGAFLGGLASALKPVGASLAMDIAGWGLLNTQFWPSFLNRGLVRFTSMTPTYDGSNITVNEAFVSKALAQLPPGSYAAGLSSQVKTSCYRRSFVCSACTISRWLWALFLLV